MSGRSRKLGRQRAARRNGGDTVHSGGTGWIVDEAFAGVNSTTAKRSGHGVLLEGFGGVGVESGVERIRPTHLHVSGGHAQSRQGHQAVSREARHCICRFVKDGVVKRFFF